MRSLFSVATGFSQVQVVVMRLHAGCLGRRTERVPATGDLSSGMGPPSPEEDTQDGNLVYANVPDSEPTRYRDGWLP